MSGLLALYLFLLPWFVIPHWLDGNELPKVLLSLVAFSLWLVLRSAYSFLGSLILDGAVSEPRRWSTFPLWIGLIGLVSSGAWFFSAHRAISWLGTGAQVSTSFAVLLIGLGLVVALRDAVQRDPRVARVFLRAWMAGMCVALVGALTRHSPGALDLLLSVPLLFLSGLLLLATRSSVEAPLTAKRLLGYRLSHAFLAMVLVGLLGVGLLVQLDALWILVFVGASATGLVVLLKQRRLTLAGFISLTAIVCSLVGLAESSAKLVMPTWVQMDRQALRLDMLTELLPNQTLSWQVVRQTLNRAPLFGVGPGSWISAFDQARPLGLNQTPLWDARFPRASSALAMVVTEYGMLPSFFGVLFLLVLLGGAFRRARKIGESTIVLTGLLVLGGLAFVALRPPTVLSLLSLALFVGLLASQIFEPAKTVISWSEQPFVSRLFVGAGFVGAIIACIFTLQRAAAAEFLTSPEPYALPFARRLNSADDFTFAEEARFYLAQAQTAANSSRIQLAPMFLDRAEKALTVARERNPIDPEHVALALQVARMRATFDERQEDSVLALAEELDELRPTDPSSPLTVFGIQRQRALREAHWVEQGQGREKEEALQRETRANTAAEQALQESLRRKPDYLPALYAKAAWLAQSGKTAEAIADLERLASAHPSAPDILLPLALLYRRTQEPGKAVDVLLRLVKDAPTVLDYQWQLSLALVQAERWEEATAVLQRLVAEAPSEAGYQTQLKEVLHKRADQFAALNPVVTTSTSSTPPATTTPRVRKPIRRRATTR